MRGSHGLCHGCCSTTHGRLRTARTGSGTVVILHRCANASWTACACSSKASLAHSSPRHCPLLRAAIGPQPPQAQHAQTIPSKQKWWSRFALERSMGVFARLSASLMAAGHSRPQRPRGMQSWSFTLQANSQHSPPTFRTSCAQPGSGSTAQSRHASEPCVVLLSLAPMESATLI